MALTMRIYVDLDETMTWTSMEIEDRKKKKREKILAVTKQISI
jgi:hypothetical protein